MNDRADFSNTRSSRMAARLRRELALPFLESTVCRTLERPIRHRRSDSLAGRPPLIGVHISRTASGRNHGTRGHRQDYAQSTLTIADVRDDVLVLTGLDKKNSHGDGHYAEDSQLSHQHARDQNRKEYQQRRISVDQLMAQHQRVHSPALSGTGHRTGHQRHRQQRRLRLYGSHSRQSPTRPVAREISPRLVYGRLFGGRITGNSARSESAICSILYWRMQGGCVRILGRDDQFKLDEYLDSVRAVERRIAFASQPRHRDWQPSETSASHSGSTVLR